MLARIRRKISSHRRSFTNFEEKEKAEENRFFRQEEARLLEKLRKTIAENTDKNFVEMKLRQIFNENGASIDSPLFRDLLNLLSK